MMKEARFSIIVPVYNVEVYIKRCLKSLTNQTYPDIQIILVDDGSTDGCPGICDEFAQKDSRVAVFHKENGGLSDARNFGMRKAVGEYIIFVDSDDYIKNDTCQTFSSMIDLYPDVEVIVGNSRRIGACRPADETVTASPGLIDGNTFLKTQMEQRTMFVTAWRNVYKKAFLFENHLTFKFGILHEDEHWTPRIFLAARKVLATDYVFYYHFIRRDSITQQKIKTQNARDIVSTCDELKEIYFELEDEKLKALLLDYLVKLYLHAFIIGKLLEEKNLLDRTFLKRYAKSRGNKRKVRLYLISPRVYFYYNFVRENYLSKSKWKRKLMGNRESVGYAEY